jgi:hypothetical protein
MKHPTFLPTLLIPLLMLSQGCATIVGSSKNTLVFENEKEQTAEIYLDGELIGNAPGKIQLDSRRIQHGSTLEIKAPGHETQEYMILRKPHPAYIIVDAIVGGIPLGIDYSTGQIYRPTPRKFTYELKPE